MNPFDFRGALVRRWLGVALVFMASLATRPCTAERAPTRDGRVQSLLVRIRSGEPAKGAWRSDGVASGPMLASNGDFRISWNHQGHFRLALDSDIKIIDAFDGRATTKLYPWGTAIDVTAQEEEMTLIPMWVLTGFWASPEAPLTISAGAEREDDLTALIVRKHNGKLDFEVLVDPTLAAPVLVRTATGVPITEWRLTSRRDRSGRLVPSRLGLRKSGHEFLKVQFNAPRNVLNKGVGARPASIAKVAYDRSVSPTLQVHNDGRGYLFVRPKINGRQLGWFLFDTGAPATILGTAAVNQLQLRELGRTQSTGVGGGAGIEIHTVQEIQLGPITVGPAGLVSMDVQRLGWRNIPIEGILGSDVFGRAIVEIHLASSSISLLDPVFIDFRPAPNGGRSSFMRANPLSTRHLRDTRATFLSTRRPAAPLSIPSTWWIGSSS